MYQASRAFPCVPSPSKLKREVEMKTQAKYDILNRAKCKGQGILLELPSAPLKYRPRSKVKHELVKQHREEIVQGEGAFYDYTKEHPELCPPMGTVFYIKNQYGVKAKLTVKLVLNGLPGTEFELLPFSEQPKHLHNPLFLAEQIGGGHWSNWVNWPDGYAWELYQEQQGKPLKPWESGVLPTSQYGARVMTF